MTRDAPWVETEVEKLWVETEEGPKEVTGEETA